jgi:tetratricopeptide (TPR) repeat protein
LKRTERHHLKQDELLTSLDQSAQWLAARRKPLVVGAVVVLALAVSGFGAKLYLDSRERKAEAAWSQALDLYHGHVGEETDAAAPSSDPHPRFSTAEERYLAALEAMEKVARDFPGQKQGRRARYYAALCQWGLGRLEDAERNLEEVVKKRGDLQYYLAQAALAAVKQQRGDAAAAIELYRVLIEDANNPMPKDELLLRLAQTRERAGKLEEAGRDYQRLLEEYPDSALRSEADSRRQLLDQARSLS